MSSKLHRAAGQDGITAELIRDALPWLIIFITLVRQWTVACAHVAQTWKNGMIITLFKKADPSKAVNYRGITLLAVLGKCFIYILIRSLTWLMDYMLLEHQYGFRPFGGRILSLSIWQRLIESSGSAKSGLYAIYIDFEQCFDRIPRRKLWRALRKRGMPKQTVQLFRD